ncbi:MAG: Uma2 family endonuclease [Proteobacteria bacterium]|nr:Uma2 family endonuclease [Pseudomonadota bacterium]
MNTVRAFPEPAWDVSRQFPAQGAWSEDEYLNLPYSRLVEFDLGRIEVLDMPSELHQALVLFLYEALIAYVRRHKLGRVLVAPLPVKLWEGKMREPDLLFMRREHASRRHENYWSGADLVMEVLSPNDPNRDKITKRQEYARAGIPEYWLVDPLEKTVTVFTLPGQADEYAICGTFGIGCQAESASLAGFSVDIDELLAANSHE